MKELLDIIAASGRLQQGGVPAVLATVVKTQGSTYRRPGARMLLAADVTTIGMVSGGCLEGDLRERITPLFASQSAELLTYDSTSSDDIVWGLGLGCAGMVHILLEGASRGEVGETLEFAEKASVTDEPFAMATVFKTSGDPGVSVGSRWVQSNTDAKSIGVCADPLAAQMHEACEDALAEDTSRVRVFPAAAGSAEVFIEVVQPALPLLIVGAGPDAVPLIRFALELGWRLTIVDTRPAYLNASLPEPAKRILLRKPADLPDLIALRGRAAAVVMTHNFNLDSQFLRVLLPSPVRYLGLLGSRQKTALLLQELQDDGFEPTATQRAKLFSPVGLDIGAETPEEIALSVIAEIQSVMAEGTGGSLRTREGSIHQYPLHV